MAAPEYVPTSLKDHPRRGLDLPPPDRWGPGNEQRLGPRPADLGASQPGGQHFGHQGPDQGYALKLARRFEGRVRLRANEKPDDVLAGAVLVALKRASLFGRAPVIHDIEVALAEWGYLDDAPDDLVDVRRPLFEGAAHTHHYADQRRIVDAVPEATLRQPPTQLRQEIRTTWRTRLRLGDEPTPAP